VKKIVENLRDFSRVDASEWHYANLEQGLESTLNIVWNEIKYKAEVIREYAGLPDVECIAAQINQVFMNLVANAVQAIPERGVITLRTGRGGDSVWVEIADDGVGIAPENLQRVFEPFFTTKPIGKGTGLGLSLAYGIVRQHGGHLTVSGEPGRGATFRVTLPRTREQR
jgi:signal transduction histidine kinase